MEGNGIKLADDILNVAIELGASDIHFEPTEEALRIRMRIDGLLREVDKIETSRFALVSRIKIMSGMDIAEKRVPQDGRSEFIFEKRKIDLRISCIPTIFGEKLVIRILDQGKNLINIDKLSFSNKNFSNYKSLYSRPYGMVLITGPTGSGKSTTLYATLSEIKTVAKNIVSIEDPIEYQLSGINQVAVNNKVGLTFAAGLKSILRQDPDIIMIGEIRDSETADIAIKAALTGHLVFSTVHTNNAISTLTRLVDMGVERYKLVSAFNGSVAQRLVRKLCNNCRKKLPAKNYETSYLNTNEFIELYNPIGCKECNHTGYRGRIAIQEVLNFDDRLKDAFVKMCSEKEMMDIAQEKGMKTLREDGQEKVLAGLTTVDELLRAGI